MGIIIANKYGAVSDVKAFEGLPNLPANVFMKPLWQIGTKGKLDQPYAQHVWTYSCINAKATALKGVPFIIVRYEKEDKAARHRIDKIRNSPVDKLYKKDISYLKSEGFDIVENGSVYNLFNNPNPLMSRSKLWESFMILMHLTGEVFWTLQDKSGIPVEMGRIPEMINVYGSSAFEPNKQDDSFVGWKKIRTEMSAEQLYTFQQVIRFYRYNPYSMRGLAPQSVTQSAGVQDLKSQILNEAIFDNGGMPGGFVKVTEFLMDDQRKKLIAGFEDRHKGAQNAGKIGVLQGGAEFIPNSNTNVDMQYMDGRKWNRDETFAGFGVPKMKASIYEDLQLATALQADKSFWQDQIIPEARDIEDVINSRLFDGSIKETQGLYCLFDFSNVEALQTNLTEKATVAKTYVDCGWPINKVNERLQLGFDEVPWGDVAWMPAGKVPVSSAEQEPEEDKPLDESDYDKGKSFETKSARKDKILASWIAKVFDEIEPAFQKKIKKYWYELRIDQLKRFDEATKAITKGVPSSAELNQILFDNQAWQTRLKEVARPFITLGANASISEACELLDIPLWSATDPRVLTILNAREAKIVGITDRFWNNLKASLTDGILKGESVQDLNKRIKSSFNSAENPSRTLTIARTETAQIASPVRHAVFVGEGVTKFEWTTAKDEHVRPDHQHFEGVGPVPAGHNYMDDVGKAGTLYYPSYNGGPVDQIINCRCVEIPVN